MYDGHTAMKIEGGGSLAFFAYHRQSGACDCSQTLDEYRCEGKPSSLDRNCSSDTSSVNFGLGLRELLA